VAKTVAPYGSWPSPISIDQVASSADPWFSWVVVDLGVDDILWIEPRPAEEGRAVLVRRRTDGSRTELTPTGFDARTRVHEYGGGAAWRHDGIVFFSHFGDGRVYRAEDNGEPRAVTPEPPEPQALRYADGRLAFGGATVICVRESHRGEVVNELVSFPADGSGEPSVVQRTSRGTIHCCRSSAASFGSTGRVLPAGPTSRSSSRSGGRTARCTGSPTATVGGTSTGTASSSPASRPSSAIPRGSSP